MAILKCDDGTEVKISTETEAELRKQFGPKKFKETGFWWMVTTKPNINDVYPILIGLSDPFGPIFDMEHPNRYFGLDNAKSLIRDIQAAIDFVEANK